MTVLEALKKSPSWSVKWDLPTFPYTNNGWVYMAYALKLSLERGENDLFEHIRSKWDFMIEKHTVLPGLIRRIDSSIASSHDEILGISYISWVLGKNTHKDIAEYLRSNFWYRYDTNFEAPWWRRSMIRFNDLPAYIQAYDRGWVGPIAMLRYCLAIFLRAKNANKGLEGGVSDDLRTWLSSSVMKKFWLSRLFLRYWNKKCKENGMDLAGLFSMEPKEPVLVLKAEGVELLS
jgi:hypothetical protein